MGVCPVLCAPPLQRSWQTFHFCFAISSCLPSFPYPCCHFPLSLTSLCISTMFLLFPIAPIFSCVIASAFSCVLWLLLGGINPGLKGGLLGAVSVLGNVMSCGCQLEKFCKKRSAEQFSSAFCLRPRGRGSSGVSLQVKQSKVILMQGINFQDVTHTVGNMESALRMELLELIQCEGEWKESTEKGGIGRFL